MAFSGQTVTLSRTARRVGLGAFDPLAFQGRVEVVFLECGSMREPQCLHDIMTGPLAGSNGSNQFSYLVGCLIGYLVDSYRLANGIVQSVEYKLEVIMLVAILQMSS